MKKLFYFTMAVVLSIGIIAGLSIKGTQAQNFEAKNATVEAVVK